MNTELHDQPGHDPEHDPAALQIPPDAIPDGASPEEIASLNRQYTKLVVESGAMAEAHATPLPGPIADAFAGKLFSYAGITLRPMVAGDFALLKQIDSPLYLRFIESHKPKQDQKPVPFDDSQAYEMIYLFSVPIREARLNLAKGRDVFQEAAWQRIGEKLGLLDVSTLVEMVVLNFSRAFATVVSHAAPKDPNVELGFQKPPSSTTASDGGSTT